MNHHSPVRALSALTAALAGAALLTAAPAHAQSSAAAVRQGPTDFVALGVALVPEFEGSSDRTAAPALLARVTLWDTTLLVAGIGAQWNLLSSSSPWAFGPVLRFTAARDEDVDDEIVQRLRPIDSSVGAGLFASYSWRGLWAQGDSLTAGIESVSDEGVLTRLNLGYQWAARGDWRFDTSVRVGVASDKYVRTYFDVDADNAQRSGLPFYSASGGVHDVALSLGATYVLSSDWMLMGRVQFGRLLGDAADSPIVDLRGSTNQSNFALAVARSF